MIIGFISLFIVSIKITFISCALIPIFFIFKNNCYSFFISKNGFIFYFAIFCIIFKNFLISGCLIYPLDYTCISTVSWSSKDIASNILLGVELLSKSFNIYNGDLNPSQYVKSYNWVNTWYSRNFEELNSFVLTSFFVFILLIISSRLKYIKLNFHFDDILIFLLLISNIVIFLKSPVIRFHHLIFILFFICLFLLIRKGFIKNNFYGAILALLILFNFNKNIIRINDTKKVFVGIQQIENQYLINEINSNEYVNIYYPDIKKNKKNGWQGRLCWDIPFICSYNKLDVGKKNGYLIINKLKIKND